MAKVKTVVTTSSETAIQLDDHYSYAWIRNIGSGDCYVSISPDIVAGADDVLSLKAGSIVRLTTKADVVYVKGATTVEVYAQNFSDCPFEKFGGEAGEIVIEPLSVTENGTYTAPTGTDGYSPVSVTVPQTTVQSLSVTQNGTYTAPTGTAYSPVTVDVQEQPWSPLQDGYSNFWFELTDDTLSPWLNFSAKNADATIDWGDGSGEVALDTLTPTHTYSKAGRYVVKCKGVTGITAQHTDDGKPASYEKVLSAVELNNEITTFLSDAFAFCGGLKHVDVRYIMSIPQRAFYFCAQLSDVKLSDSIRQITLASLSYCPLLSSVNLPTSLTSITQTSIAYNMSLENITIPANVSQIDINAFVNDRKLSTIHVLRTTPPTLGTNAFLGLPSNFIIYVPVGYGETYKAASGWSTYASHIVEEGQTVTRAMKAKFAKEKALEEDTGDMR
jgi:hypothetical protein